MILQCSPILSCPSCNLFLLCSFGFVFLCQLLVTKMDPSAFSLHEGKLFVSKQEVVHLGWESAAQSKKLKGSWKGPKELGIT